MEIIIEPFIIQSGSDNMSQDIQRFQSFESGKIGPQLRIYSWLSPCISLGYTQSAEKQLDLDFIQQLGWEVVRRPTGGGMVFHNCDEVTFSLILPYDYPGLPSGMLPAYKFLAQPLVNFFGQIGIDAKICANHHLKKDSRKKPSADQPTKNTASQKSGRTNLCFAYPAEYEIVARGKKIAGCAQKRGQRGLLQQGSIFVSKNGGDQFIKALIAQPVADVWKNAICIEDLTGAVPDKFEMAEKLLRCFQEKLRVDL